jgi:hypothetical protein
MIFVIDSNESNKEQLKITKESLDSSKTAFRKMNYYLDSISSSSGGLSYNLSTISQEISNLPIKIDSISNSLDKLNKITQKEQSIAEKEAARKPKFSISNLICEIVDSISTINYIEFLNEGDIEAEIDIISCVVPSDILLSYDNSKATFISKENNKSIFIIYSRARDGQLLLIPKFPRYINPKFSFTNKNDKEIEIELVINYISRNISGSSNFITKACRKWRFTN